MLVELDVFSGRVNPRWQLEGDQENQVRELQQRLCESTESAPELPALGYRGFVYILDGVSWRAWKATVASPDRALLDPARTVERHLLDRLPSGHSEVRERIVAELDQN